MWVSEGRRGGGERERAEGGMSGPIQHYYQSCQGNYRPCYMETTSFTRLREGICASEEEELRMQIWRC